MKNATLVLGFCLAFSGLTIESAAQELLPGVTVVAVNYKYLKAVDQKDAGQPVRMLERKAAAFDVKKAEFYEDDYDTYFVSFYIPEGNILAAYDKDGKLLRTAEKFKNIALPPAIREAVAKRFPNWSISKDVYLVKYYNTEGAGKTYKLLLENGSKRLRVKANEKGEFIDKD